MSAAGLAPSTVRLDVRPGSAGRAVARASANRIICTWCTQYVFGGFGNTQTLEYWVRSAASPIISNGRAYWWGDAQYYQNYAGGYVTTFRYWHYWNGTGWVHYATVDIGP
jgi:hypothetical protein